MSIWLPRARQGVLTSALSFMSSLGFTISMKTWLCAVSYLCSLHSPHVIFFFYLSPLHLAVRIYTQKQVYATDTDITFLAVTEEPGPLEFLWDFGDRRPVRTTSKAITQKFHNPKRLLLSTYSIFCNSMSIILDNWIVSFCIIRYDVTVRALCSKASTVSDVYTVIVQREVKPNKLQFQSSVLINTAVDFKCRISAGTDVTYLWSFGDGTTRLGQTTEQHVFDRWVLALTI